MSKDPALLWYFNDWMGGTATLSRHLKGCYMDLLSVQFNSGPLTLEEIKIVLGSDFGSSWPTLQKKFKFFDGLYFNERLQSEKERRSSFSKRQSIKSSKRWNPAHAEGMPIENTNVNVNRNITIKNTYGEFGNVQLFEDEYQKLVTSLTEKNTKILIAELDTYIATKGKDKYANHYAAIQTWARRKFNDHEEKKLLSGKKEKYIA